MNVCHYLTLHFYLSRNKAKTSRIKLLLQKVLNKLQLFVVCGAGMFPWYLSVSPDDSTVLLPISYHCLFRFSTHDG